MTRRRSSPLGLELVVSVVLALVTLPLLSHGAPLQDSHADLQKYSEGCYYNYNHYSEGDRILTNEPCLNCTCHNRMLMCYLRVCPFTKSIGQDCTVEKREDQCCPIITCPEVPVDVSHHNNQLTTHAPGTELSIPEKYGCSIDSKFYPEGAQVPSNPSKPCELCYCIKNRTACLMQECTLHIDGCQPIYNKGSCCPVRYSCDHENELLELEDFSTTTTTVRPTTGYILTSTMSPSVTTDCVHNKEVYADGASITGKSACEHCYCMRGDIVCAVQECEMPTLESGAKTCRALPPAEGECCPSNYVCDDDTATTEVPFIDGPLTTIAPKSDLHEFVSQEDLQLQEHIDDIEKIAATEVPDKLAEHSDSEVGSGDDTLSGQAVETTVSPVVSEAAESSEEDKNSEEGEERPLFTTVSAIKETSYETTQASIEAKPTHKTEEGLEDSHIIIGQDKEYDSTQAPIEDEIINEDIVPEEDSTTLAPVIEDLQDVEEAAPPKVGLDEITTATADSSSDEEDEEDQTTTVSPIDVKKPEESSTVEAHKPPADIDVTTITPIKKTEQKIEDIDKVPATDSTPEDELESSTDSSSPTKTHIKPDTSEDDEESSGAAPSEQAPIDQATGQDRIDQDQDIVEHSTDSATVSPVYEMVTEGEDGHVILPAIGDHKTEEAAHDKKPKDTDEISTASPVSDADDVKKDYELPVESTTLHSAVSEEVDIVTASTSESSIKPDAPIGTGQETELTEQEEFSTEAEDLEVITTSRPSIVKVDASTEGAIEGVQKPIGEETPAVVQEITETSSAPTTKDEEATYQTTALPAKETSDEEITESGEETSSEEEDQQSTESLPTHIHKDIVSSTVIPLTEEGETETAILPSKGLVVGSEAEHQITEAPISDEEGIKVQPETEIVDSTTISSSAADSEAPSSEEIFKEQPEHDIADSATSVPSVDESELPSTEEDKAKPEQESTASPAMAPDTEAGATVVPSIVSGGETVSEDEGQKQSEEALLDLTTIAPSVGDSEASTSGGAVKGQPEQGITDSTTRVPFADETEEIKGQPEEDIATISPSVDDSKTPSSAEEGEIKEQPGHGVSDSTIIPPSADDQEIVDSTVASEKPADESDEVKEQPEQDTTGFTTTVSSLADSEGPSSEEEVKKHPEVIDATTVSSSFDDSKTPSSEDEEVKGKPEQDFADSTTIASSLEESESHDTEDDIKIHPEQGIIDLSTIVPSIADSEEAIKGQPEHGIVDSTTIASSLADSEGAIEGQTEKGISEFTTIAPPGTDIKAKPEEGIVDSTTTVPPAADSETDIKGKPEQGIAESTTVASPVADSEEEIKEEPEHTGDSTSIAPSDSEGEIKGQPDYTTIATTLVSKKPISEVEESEQEDIRQTTLSPSSDVQSTEIVDAAEGSGQQMQEIIPAAIPGEGDCLVNDKTFANNETVPSSNECELSCSCISSVVVCQKVPCFEPAQPNNCVLDEASTDRCCPQYICGADSFAEEQQPSTVADIEDEEIEFTTIAPTKKYPDVSGHESVKPAVEIAPTVTETDESTSHKPEGTQTVKPIQVDSEDKFPDGSGQQSSDADITTVAAITVSEEQTIKPLLVDGEDIVEDGSTKTEKPDIPDESSSTPSVDIKFPVSHVKDDVSQEESTEVASSAEESTEEQASDEKIQTIPSATDKPSEEVTGDIDESIRVTAIPDLTAPSKKPSTTEESTTPKTVEDSSKPAGAEEEEEEVVVGGPKIDESVFTTESAIESDSTTIKPVAFKPDTDAPSLTSILGSGISDSEESAETPETPEESSNESGEESDEDTQEQKLDTVSPIASEQSTTQTIHTDLAGEISPAEGTTIEHESDYQKPELPEDMSHTKIEETETKRPLEPESTGESAESEESEESMEKATESSSPPKAPASTGLTSVVPSEKDHFIPEITDKKDEFPTMADSFTERPLETLDQSTAGKPISSSVTPVASEEEALPGTVAPVSGGPVDNDEITSQTSSPTVEGQPITDKSDISSQTGSSAVGEQEISVTLTQILGEASEEEKDGVSAETSAPTIEDTPGAVTQAPVYGDESEEEKNKIPSQTDAPAVEDTVTEKDEVVSPTGTPITTGKPIAPISGDESTETSDELSSETTSPVLEVTSQTSAPSGEEQPITGTVAPALGAVSEEGIDSQTTAPVPSSEDEAHDEIASHTIVPVYGLDDKLSQVPTSSSRPYPSIEEASTIPSSGEDEDNIAGTAKPIVEEKYPFTEEQKPSVQIPIQDEEKENDVATIAAPAKDTDAEIDATEAPASFTPVKTVEEEHDDLEVNVVNTSSVSAGDEEYDATETPAVSTPVKAVEIEDEELDATAVPVTLTPVKAVETGEEDLDVTEAPVKTIETGETSTSSTPVKVIETGEGDLDVTAAPATSTTIKSVETGEEDLDATEAPAISIPVNTSETGDHDFDATETPTSSTPVKVIETGEEDLDATTASATSIPIKAIETGEEDLDATEAPAISIPVNTSETGDHDFDATETPTSSTPVKVIETGEEDLDATTASATSTPIKAIETGDHDLDTTEAPKISTPVKVIETEDEDLDATAAPATSVPIKAIETEEHDLDAIEALSSSTTAKTVEAGEEDYDATAAPATSIPIKADEAVESDDFTEATATSTPVKAVQTAEEDIYITETPTADISKEIVPSPAPIVPVEKDESFEGTQTPVLSEETSSVPSTVLVSHAEENDEEGSAQTSSPISGDDTSPNKTDRDSEEKLGPEVSTEEIFSYTEGPVSEDKPHIDKNLAETETPLSETTATEGKLEYPATELPSSHTDKPASIEDDSSAQTETPISASKPVVVPEVITMDEVTLQPGKPDSDDQVSVNEGLPTTAEPPSDEVPIQTESSIDEKEPQVDEKKPSSDESAKESDKPSHSEKPETDDEILAQTEKPISEQKDGEIPSVENATPISADEPGTEQVVDQTESPIVSSIPKDKDEITTQTAKPISDEQHLITDTTSKPSEDSSALSEPEEEEEKEIASTIAPLDIAQTSTPSVSEAPIVPVKPESTIDASTEESDEEHVQTEAPRDEVKIQTVAEFVTDRIDEQTTVLPVVNDTKKDQIPEKPVATPSEEASTTSSEEEEEEEDHDISTEKDTIVPVSEDTDKKTPAPEIPEDQNLSTESAIQSTSTEKPIVPVDSKYDTDVPKPMVTDEEISEEAETPLATTFHPLYPHIDLDLTTSRPALNASDKIDTDAHVPESTALPAHGSSSTLAPTAEQSTTSQSATNAPTTQYQPPGYVPPQYPTYPEDEYTDEDETEVFGPGTCRYGGKLFVSAQQIPRDDPCDFCFCFRSDIICLQQSCPPPISGCHEEPISGFCCPRYECPVSMATVLNITTSTTTTSTTLPPHFLHHAYRGAAAKNGCHINGKSYKVGDKIDSASGPCMHCTCGGDGQMKCDPKTCSPEPMLRQMIAVVASRRR